MTLKDYDILDTHILELNEKGWDIRRVDYKLINNVMFEMPTIDAIPKDEVKRLLWKIWDELADVTCPIVSDSEDRQMVNSYFHAMRGVVEKHIKEIVNE